MRGRAVDRRWLWPFVGVAVFVVACGLLAWWQWDRAQSVSGTARNLAYALEWPSFAGFAVYMLYRAIKLQRAADDEADADAAEAEAQPGSAIPVADTRTDAIAEARDTAGAGVLAEARVTADAGVTAEAEVTAGGVDSVPVVPRQEAKVWTARRPSDVADPEPDPELDQYNQYLAMLHAADEERG